MLLPFSHRRPRSGPAFVAVVVSAVCVSSILAPDAVALEDMLVSLSTDSELAGAPVRDQELVRHADGGTARVTWPSETLALISGDLSGNGSAEVFGDVDALHESVGGATAVDGLYLSLLSNEDGFLDGDVLRATPAGFVVHRSEAEFEALIGSLDGEIDVDAFQLDDDGTMLFSLAENEESSLLSGDAVGWVADGDILIWAPGDPQAAILFTESQVDDMVSAALGASTTMGDVKGLARDPQSGAVLFSVQSPSNHDASVFSTAGGGALVAGQTEADFGFGTNAELDALTVARSSYRSLTVSSGQPQAGETLTIELAGAAPGEVWIILAALDWEAAPVLGLDGWGGLVLSPDVLFSIMLGSAANLAVVTDGTGAATFTDDLGPGVPAIDVVVQAISPSPTLSSTNPVLLELGQ